MNNKIFLLMLLFVLSIVNVFGTPKDDFANTGTVSLAEFVKLATENDRVFDEILLDQLKLNYQKDLLLPPEDLILSVKGAHYFSLHEDKEKPEYIISLERLFRGTGTHVAFAYRNTPSFLSDKESSAFQFLISQPVAENAFGKLTELRDKLIGLENDIISHQIIEAYEDYLARLLTLYYDWYSSYEDVRIGETSYQENQKLLDNIYERQKQNIAHPVDVHKVELLVLGKKEDLLAIKENYRSITLLIKKSIGMDADSSLVPVDPAHYHSLTPDFEKDFQEFTKTGRTYKVLKLLKNRSSLTIEKNVADLLPSVNLLFGYSRAGDDWLIKKEDNQFYTGVSMTWPFPDKSERAELELSRIEYQKILLSNHNHNLELETNLKNLFWAMEREKELIRIADDKIKLSESVLKDESENYSFGKISLNDYIDAVNRLDQNKFNKITHIVQLKKLTVEWLRITDHLVQNGEELKSYQFNSLNKKAF